MRKRSRAKASERKHAVYANLNVPELTKAGSGLELYIYARGEKLGEVDIGRGGFYWKGGGRHRREANLLDRLRGEDGRAGVR
jgi:hypothetical protein